MIGAALGAAATIGSSIIGSRSSKKQAREAAAQAQAQFDQQMDHTVRRRVEDAKRAGIHPLYALGSGPGASPTISAGQHATGSAIGDGIGIAGRAIGRAYDSKKQQEVALRAAELQRIEQVRTNDAQIARDQAAANFDNARALALTSRAKTAEARTNQIRPTPSDVPEPMVHDKGYKGSINTGHGTFRQRSKRSPADVWSQRYGEPGEWIGGILGITEDVGSAIGNSMADIIGPGSRGYYGPRRHADPYK